MSVMIKIDHVSKAYKLGQIGGTTLRDELQRFSAKLHGREDPTARIGARKIEGEGTFLALDDVSFRVEKGERLGIIGRNGAGKSTLLKLISRITAPTEGFIGLNGRVASMLEVGTGFHTELTGRENIYMNGAILGMTRKEIDRKLEDIIEFSECREFIDTPVKRYSSGMFVKLAFAVAAHLDAEILIMDEVLAVGDVAFQRKCLEKMNEVSQSLGRTILYVSHNMNTIRELCSRCVVLDHGKVIFDGDVQPAIDMYMQTSFSKAATMNDLGDRRRYGRMGEKLRLQSIELCRKDRPVYEHGEEMILRIRMRSKIELDQVGIRVEIGTTEGNLIGTTLAENAGAIIAGENEVTLSFLTEHVVPGQYQAIVTLYQKDAYRMTSNLDWVRDAFLFEITDHSGSMPLNWVPEKWGRVILNPMKVVCSAGLR